MLQRGHNLPAAVNAQVADCVLRAHHRCEAARPSCRAQSYLLAHSPAVSLGRCQLVLVPCMAPDVDAQEDVAQAQQQRGPQLLSLTRGGGQAGGRRHAPAPDTKPTL